MHSTLPDLPAITARVAAHVASAVPGAEVSDVSALPGGACQDNFVVSASEAGKQRRWALRSDARSSLLGSISRRIEAPVVNAAADAGVLTPPAQWLAEGLVREGAWAYFMPWVDGVAIGRKIVADPGLSRARGCLSNDLAVQLARIHSLTPRTSPSLFDGAAPPADAGRRAIADIERYLGDLPDIRPAITRLLGWLRENVPPAGEIVCNHGDFRTGNFMVTDAGLQGILDWEFAHWGARAEDIAWICVRDWRFGRLDRPVGGFGQRAPFLSAYEAAAGVAIDPAALLWWEVMGNVRWAVGAVQQSLRYLSGKERDIEHLAIGRRACEMEWEALRLVRLGVPRWRDG